MQCGLKGRESVDPTFEGSPPACKVSRPFRPQDGVLFFPGRRPSASALGWGLSARWAALAVGGKPGVQGVLRALRLGGGGFAVCERPICRERGEQEAKLV